MTEVSTARTADASSRSSIDAIFCSEPGPGSAPLALADLLAAQGLLAGDIAPAGPAGARDWAFSGQSQVGHLAVHGRGAERGRHVRSQAGTHQARRPDDFRSTSSTAIPGR